MPSEWKYWRSKNYDQTRKNVMKSQKHMAYQSIFTWQVNENAMRPELLVPGDKGRIDVHYNGHKEGTLRMGWAPVDFSEHASEKQLKDTMDHIQIKQNVIQSFQTDDNLHSLCGIWMSHIHAIDPANHLHGNKLIDDKSRFIEHRWTKKKVPYKHALLHDIRPHTEHEANESQLFGKGKGHKEEMSMKLGTDMKVNVVAYVTDRRENIAVIVLWHPENIDTLFTPALKTGGSVAFFLILICFLGLAVGVQQWYKKAKTTEERLEYEMSDVRNLTRADQNYGAWNTNNI